MHIEDSGTHHLTGDTVRSDRVGVNDEDSDSLHGCLGDIPGSYTGDDALEG